MDGATKLVSACIILAVFAGLVTLAGYVLFKIVDHLRARKWLTAESNIAVEVWLVSFLGHEEGTSEPKTAKVLLFSYSTLPEALEVMPWMLGFPFLSNLTESKICIVLFPTKKFYLMPYSAFVKLLADVKTLSKEEWREANEAYGRELDALGARLQEVQQGYEDLLAELKALI